LGYLLKAVGGACLFLASVALFNVELIALLEVGTCASGNTAFEIARPCPEGTGTDILLLTGSIFTGLIGLGLFIARGKPPWGRGRGSGLSTGLLAWGIFFGVTGAIVLYHSLTSETIGADGETGGAIVGVTFLLMGLPALAIAFWTAAGDLRGRSDPDQPVASAPWLPTHAGSSAGAPSGWISSIRPAPGSDASGVEPDDGDDLARLERLQRLRESGALTEAEFQAQKRRILGG